MGVLWNSKGTPFLFCRKWHGSDFCYYIINLFDITLSIRKDFINEQFYQIWERVTKASPHLQHNWEAESPIYSM